MVVEPEVGPRRRVRVAEARLREVLEERLPRLRVARRLQRHPVGLLLDVARDRVLERRARKLKRTSTRSASGIASGARMPPRRRVAQAIRKAPGNAKSAYQAIALDEVVARLVAELVREHEPHLGVREAAVEQRVPEEDLPRRAEAGRERVGGARVPVDVLDRPGCCRRPSFFASTRKSAASCGSRSGCEASDEVRRDEREQREQPDEEGGAGDPPVLADQPRQAHHDQHRDAEEDELDAEPDPAAEDHLAVAHVRDVVPAVPPQRRDLEREPDEPDEREAEHREQHPRADRPGRRVAQEALAPARVEQEDDERHRASPARESNRRNRSKWAPCAEQARGEEVARRKAADVEVARDARRVPQEVRGRGPAPASAVKVASRSGAPCASQSSPTSTLTCTRSRR